MVHIFKGSIYNNIHTHTFAIRNLHHLEFCLPQSLSLPFKLLNSWFYRPKFWIQNFGSKILNSGFWQILDRQNLEFRILAVQNLESRILAIQNLEFRILVFQNIEFSILPFQNLEFKILQLKILNSGFWSSKILNSGFCHSKILNSIYCNSNSTL